MEQSLHTQEASERIWQRVAPTLEPYGPGQAEAVRTGAAQVIPGGAVRALSALPGAERNPCCMGSAAADELAVLTGFLEDERTEGRYLTALSCAAPRWARQRLRDMAAAAQGRGRRLEAVYYLITGELYEGAVSLERIYVGRWLPALRERYHAAACTAMNYRRAAEGTTDPCLSRLLTDMSEESFRDGAGLLALLTRSVGG